ncbi:MAG: hypothetical protein M3P18_11860 [Actinomycetota bacterium]|nr:hypothetical protein [Actinomycetota bacterium]
MRKATSDVSLELNAWWRRQRKWKTKSDAAKALGMPPTTFRGYFRGIAPTPANRAKLHAATGLAVFDDTKTGTQTTTAAPVVDEADARLSEVSDTLRVLSEQFASLHEVFEQLKAREQPAQLVPFPKRASTVQRADEVNTLLYRLIAVLDGFRSSRADRDVLRRRLHGPDVGYLASLATALLEEERFQSWDAVSSYRPLGVQR